MYEPQEDSFLLKDFVKRAKGIVLDMGTGSGILAVEAAKYADFVVGVDIQETVIKIDENKFKEINNLRFIKSDLFEFFEKNILEYKKNQFKVKKTLKSENNKTDLNKKINTEKKETNNKKIKFNYILFNPPYLPEDKNEPEDSAIETTGGKHGWEIVERFFDYVSGFLEQDGKILLLFSSLTNKPKVEEIIADYLFEFKELAKKSMFFETLYVYEISKSKFLRDLEKKDIKNIKRLTKGHRGLIYIGELNNKKIAIKKQKEPNMVTVAREAGWLKLLNKQGIGPTLLFSGRDYFGYEFIEGMFIPEFFEKENKTRIKKVILDVFRQCHQLDQLQIDKEEMHHPYKHIIIDKKSKPWLLDFERANKTLKPKNVTQFCQYIASWSENLNKKGFDIDPLKLRSASKAYKHDLDLKKLFQSLF